MKLVKVKTTIFILILSVIFCGNMTAQDSLAIADSVISDIKSDSTIAGKVETKKSVRRLKKHFVFAKVRSGGRSFLVAPPEGWVLDDKSGRDQGLDVVLYPEGWNMDYAPALMYTKIITKNGANSKSFTEIVSEQVKQLKDYGAVILKDSIAYTYDNKQSVIINFIDKTTQSNNMVSYINEYSYVVSMILTSQNKDEFLKSKPKFLELVNSYKLK